MNINTNNFIPFARPEIDSDDIDAVVNTMKSGWLTTGPKCIEFENAFRNYLSTEFECLAVNSATSGLHLALEAMGVGEGDEVITTVHTFTATAEIIRYLGAHPVFVDIDPETLCIDPNLIESAITKKTKAIIPVHFAGLSAPMNEIMCIAKKHNLFVLEDAAHALPTTYCTKKIGTLNSDATVFSFYANKTMTTGEGGMVVTRNLEFAKRIRTMRLHGINRDAFDRFTSRKPSWYYEVVAPGYKYNMTDISASIGISQLKKVDDFQKRRSGIAKKYCSSFSALPVKLPPMPHSHDIHSWHLFVLQLNSECPSSRDEIIQKLFDVGIGCSVHYIPLHMQPYWKMRYELKSSDFPCSTVAYENTLSLPIYSSMRDEEVNKVIASVRVLLS